MTLGIEVTAIVPVSKRCRDIAELAPLYIESLGKLDGTFEIIFVVDGDKPEIFSQIKELAAGGTRIRIVKFAREFGEATAISAGFKLASGKIILTLPAYFQIEPGSIDLLINALDTADMAVALRSPRQNKSVFEVYRRNLFHWLIKVSSGENYSDLGCSARAFKREILEEIQLYGEQHNFLPILASKQGFRVREVEIPQSPRDWYAGRYGFKFYLHRILDIFSVVFLVRFTKKPIRFFGMIGTITFIFGALVVFTVIIQRILYDMPLADRPALLVGSLLTVLGLQIFALGLLGELIIFTHAREIKEYAIEEIIN